MACSGEKHLIGTTLKSLIVAEAAVGFYIATAPYGLWLALLVELWDLVWDLVGFRDGPRQPSEWDLGTGHANHLQLK